VIDACRPFEMLKDFSAGGTRQSPIFRRKVEAKFHDILRKLWGVLAGAHLYGIIPPG